MMKKSKIFKKLHSVAKGITAIGLVSCLTALPLMASSHSEAPLISMDRYADNTDVYAFRSIETGRNGLDGNTAYVTLIANYIPFQDPSGGPQFYRFDDSVLYEINIDNTGDGLPDLSYQFRFQSHMINSNTILGHTAANQDGVVSTLNDPDYNQPQFYTVVRHNHNTQQDITLASNVPMPPSNVGPVVTSGTNYEGVLGVRGVHTINSAGTRIFAGQRDEGFLVDVGGVFDFLNLKAKGISTTDGFNVNSIAIEVPISDLTTDGKVPTSSTASNAVIGVYATASRQSTRVIGNLNQRTFSGNFVQVSRLGNPLVNEVVIPLGLKDAFNAIRPNVDGTIPQVVTAITDPELAKLIKAKGFVANIPPAPRNDLVAIFATGIKAGTVPGLPNYTTFLSDGVAHEMMRLNVAIPPTPYGNATFNRLGLLGGDPAGFPNGRRVEDDVVDIELRAVAGGTPFTPATNVAPNNTLGDGVMGNDVVIFPMAGTPCTGDLTSGSGLPAGSVVLGTGVSAGGACSDYLQRFPYLAPPQPGDTARRSNQR
ncbi:MAG: DUF4331 domain-containing protein [Pyrinomonadaceae bacterium]